MATVYRLNASQSRFTVQAFAGGLLSFFAHSPTFAVREFQGEMFFDPDKPREAKVEATVNAESLELLDNVRPADRTEIEGRMRREVLETSIFPQIRFASEEISATAVAANHYRARIAGLLSLHGVTNRHTVEADLLLYDDGVRLTGRTALRLSDHRIRPVTALGGTIKLKDEIRAVFDLVAWKDTEPRP